MKIRHAFTAFLIAAALQAPLAGPACAQPPAASPQSAADALLAADRAFSEASGRTPGLDGLAAMFADGIVLPLPDGRFVRGRAEALAALGANPAAATSLVAWSPLRAGLSADGEHGFTFGTMTIARADGSVLGAKYLSYWVRGPEGWRVMLYKRLPRLPDEPETAAMAPALPARLVAPSVDAAALARHRDGLAAAERAFAADAQAIGLGPAFRRWGSADAVNLGAGPGFVTGADAIGAGLDGVSGLDWAPDEGVLVASSGDLGVTWGWIRAAGPVPEGRPAAIPYFTIWRRASPDAPWRYVAE